jgi:hypothetical protein
VGGSKPANLSKSTMKKQLLLSTLGGSSIYHHLAHALDAACPSSYCASEQAANIVTFSPWQPEHEYSPSTEQVTANGSLAYGKLRMFAKFVFKDQVVRGDVRWLYCL